MRRHHSRRETATVRADQIRRQRRTYAVVYPTVEESERLDPHNVGSVGRNVPCAVLVFAVRNSPTYARKRIERDLHSYSLRWEFLRADRQEVWIEVWGENLGYFIRDYPDLAYTLPATRGSAKPLMLKLGRLQGLSPRETERRYLNLEREYLESVADDALEALYPGKHCMVNGQLVPMRLSSFRDCTERRDFVLKMLSQILDIDEPLRRLWGKIHKE